MEKQNDSPLLKLVDPPPTTSTDPTQIGAQNAPVAPESTQPTEVPIHPTEWHPNEIAWVLGLQKKVDEKTHRVDYAVTNQNLLVAVINNLIHIYRTNERARMGIVGGTRGQVHPFVKPS